jgi:hypothetical protein
MRCTGAATDAHAPHVGGQQRRPNRRAQRVICAGNANQDHRSGPRSGGSDPEVVGQREGGASAGSSQAKAAERD